MIFRRLAQHLKEQNWTAIGIEFILLITGILIALQVTEWNESRRERIREHGYLTRMAVEMDLSIKDIEIAIALTNRRREMGELLMRSVSDPALVRSHPGLFVMAIPQAGYTYSPKVRSLAFDEARNAGDLDVFQDKELMFDIAEFHAEIEISAQWEYLRAARQTEYTQRSAGILSYEQIVTTSATPSLQTPEFDATQAMAVHARMLERPDFIEWLPMAADRVDEIKGLETLLASAKELRDRIRAETEDGGQ